MLVRQRRIGVLTSGGDAPGMNAAVRAVVRTALERGWHVFGVSDGYTGLLERRFRELSDRDVGGILQLGGTVLGSARCSRMMTPDGIDGAVRALGSADLDALVVIGGNGSQSASHEICRRGVDVVGVASTIDNDLEGCDVTIGATTAVDVALEAIDRLKVTASSHHHAFLVEVMGRTCGYLALMAGIAGGAEAVAIPELPSSTEQVAQAIRAAYSRGKSHAIVVVAEGIAGGVARLASELGSEPDGIGFDVRVTRIGHVQRGGAPASFDRLLASRTGAAAIDALATGQKSIVVGVARGAIRATPLGEVAGRVKPIDPSLFELARVLAR